MAPPVVVLLAELLNPKVAAITLWVGLGVLTLTLAALMVTRWGQTQSIAKCAALSVWAHVLLAVYATTVDIVFTPPSGNGRDGTIYIQGVEAVATSADRTSESGESTGTLKPWERFADAEALRPAANNPSPARAPAEPAKGPQRVASDPDSDTLPAFAAETLTDAAVTLPQPKPLAVEAARAKPAVARAAEPIEPVAPVASAAAAGRPTVALPKPGGLPRLAEGQHPRCSGIPRSPARSAQRRLGQSPSCRRRRYRFAIRRAVATDDRSPARPADAEQFGCGRRRSRRGKLDERRAGKRRRKRP
jgi:hypothetical protein